MQIAGVQFNGCLAASSVEKKMPILHGEKTKSEHCRNSSLNIATSLLAFESKPDFFVS